MSLESEVYQAVNRMSEFYEQGEMVNFVDYCSDNKIPQYGAMLFLDGQTRAQYWLDYGRQQPNICEYQELVKLYNESGGFK